MTARIALDALTTEEDFTSLVVEYAQLRRWLVFHPRPLRRADGTWRTATQGDTGFCDLVMVRAPRLVFAELKRQTGKLGAAQAHWLHGLEEVARIAPTVEVHLWRPSDWPEIEAVLA